MGEAWKWDDDEVRWEKKRGEGSNRKEAFK